MPSLSGRSKIAARRVARQPPRDDQRLPERQVSAHTHATGRLIARATGTTWAPVQVMSRKNGGGVLYDFVPRTGYRE